MFATLDRSGNKQYCIVATERESGKRVALPMIIATKVLAQKTLDLIPASYKQGYKNFVVSKYPPRKGIEVV